MALRAKAKENPSFRFYALYDKVYRADVFQYAYARCKANQGASGVDGEQFEDIEAYGLERWLWELAQDLRKETYESEAIRRAYIPKPNNTPRPLGIATIRDRVAMTAGAPSTRTAAAAIVAFPASISTRHSDLCGYR